LKSLKIKIKICQNFKKYKIDRQVRRRTYLRMVHKVNSGHRRRVSLGCTEFIVALYNEIMELKRDLIWLVK